MTPDELREIGQRLYGARWQTPLARDLGVAGRTVRRWLAGKHPIPPLAARLIHRLDTQQG